MKTLLIVIFVHHDKRLYDLMTGNEAVLPRTRRFLIFMSQQQLRGDHRVSKWYEHWANQDIFNTYFS